MENIGDNSSDLFLQSSHPVNVYYEDTDFSGYVYHANYLKFFERARSEMIGLGLLKEMFTQNFHYVISQIQIDFKKPARFGDSLLIKSKAFYSKSPSLLFEQSVWRVKDDQPLVELVSAKIKLVGVNEKGRPTPHPTFVLDAYDKLRTQL